MGSGFSSKDKLNCAYIKSHYLFEHADCDGSNNKSGFPFTGIIGNAHRRWIKIGVMNLDFAK